jgi:hypothetical protein
VSIFEAGDEPGVLQRPSRGDHGRGLEEQVEILRLPVDAGVFVDGVCAGDDIGNTRGVHSLQSPFVDFALFVRDPEIAVCERLPFLRREPPRPPAPEIRHRHLSIGDTSPAVPLAMRTPT